MLKRSWLAGAAALALLALSGAEGLALSGAEGAAGSAWAQDGPKPKPDDKFRPDAPQKEDEEDLTPEKAMALLKEVRELMEKAEELLNTSSRGKALETEQELLEKLKDLLKEDPQAAQKKILEKIERLMSKSEGQQQGAVERLGEIIRKAKSSQGQGSQKQQQRQPQQQTPQQPGNPAVAPYDPNRNSEPTNKFRSKGDRTGRWGDLPPRIREAMLTGKRDIDDFPPEFQQILKEYMRKLAEDKE